jgi:DNA excision repair protein ERCC-2
MPPGSERCRNCGRSMDGNVSNQMSLYDMMEQPAPKVVKTENAKAPFFPYEPRANQLDIIHDMYTALEAGQHIVVESGTGTGKTIVSLAAALQHAKAHSKRIVYLTRTISQSDQVMRELRAISQLHPVTGMTVTGRGRSCPLLRTLSGYEDIPPSVLANLCEEKKNKSNQGQGGGCEFYEKMKERLDETEGYCRQALPTSEQLDRYCEERGACPYETKKALLKYMGVVVAPYVHLLDESIRNGFLGNMESDGTNLVLIVDEAHNLIDTAREQESYSIPMRLIEAAVDESTTMKGDPPLAENLLLRPFLDELKRAVKGLADAKLPLGTKEALIESGELEGKLCKRFGLDRAALNSAVERLTGYGDERTQLLIDRGENRISDIYTLGTGLKAWFGSDQQKYIKSIEAGEDGESLHAACIDPFDVTAFIRSVRGAIHMSGTLRPLDQYVRVMGLPKNTVTKVYPSPFPPENRSVIYLENVTTRYEDMKQDPSIFSRMEKNIAKLCNAVDRNTLVFFPSYGLMSRMRPFLERDVHKTAFWEEQRQQRRTMAALDRFRQGRNGVFFTVMGGSIAEGIDFPGDQLCFAIIVGIPFPPPSLESKAMTQMFNARYGQGMGWRYVSEVPALRKMKQAIGRLIRTETDRGMAVIFDFRTEKYAKELEARLSKDPVGDAVLFFEKDNQH